MIHYIDVIYIIITSFIVEYFLTKLLVNSYNTIIRLNEIFISLFLSIITTIFSMIIQIIHNDFSLNYVILLFTLIALAIILFVFIKKQYYISEQKFTMALYRHKNEPIGKLILPDNKNFTTVVGSLL